MNYTRISHDPLMRMLMNNFMNQEQETERRCRFTPATNIAETDQAFQIEIAVPGFNKEDFRIHVEKDVLNISTEINKEEKNEEKAGPVYRMREFGHCSFNRSFNLGETIDTDGIKAEYTNGILVVTLPKKEVVKITKEVQVM